MSRSPADEAPTARWHGTARAAALSRCCVGSVCSVRIVASVSLVTACVSQAQTRGVAVRASAASAGGPRREVSALRDADAAQRAAGGRRAASRAAGRQHAADRPRRQRVDPTDKLGSRTAGARCSIRAPTTKSASEIERRDRFHRRRDGRRRRHRSHLRQHGRDEGQLRRPACACCRTSRGVRRSRRRRSSGSGSSCCRACRSASRIRISSPTPCSTASSTASIPTACRRPARRRRSPPSRATISSRFTSSYFVPNNAILAIVGDVTADEAFDGVRKVFGDWERKRCRRDVHRAARADAPRDRRQQA